MLAIGNPFGLGNTVTFGIVSALGRNYLGVNRFEDFIQTDAAINPGNSGGALIDTAGNLVGINSTIYSQSGGSLGIGFSIPVSLARNVFEQIVRDGEVTRGWLGIEPSAGHRRGRAGAGARATEGVVIRELQHGGPAERAGMQLHRRRRRDRRQADARRAAAAGAHRGTAARLAGKVRVMRAGKAVEVDVTVGKRDRRPIGSESAAGRGRRAEGCGGSAFSCASSSPASASADG